MTDVKIIFSHPWFLLLFVLALALTFIPYFTLKKRYRRTRNRITSMIIHLVVMALAILVFAGTTITYKLPQDLTEIMLVVDYSDSGSELIEKRDDYIMDILSNNDDTENKIGIVTFGYDQVYALELTNKTRASFDDYQNAEKPDTTATNIKGAIEYAYSLLEKPETAKIVIMSDGLETDGQALGLIKQIASKGTKFDSIILTDDRKDNEVQVTNLEIADTVLYSENKEFAVRVSLKSNYEGPVYITLSEDGVADDSNLVKVSKGDNTFTISHIFKSAGLHRMEVSIGGLDDKEGRNNSYVSYSYLQAYSKILILEHEPGESENYRNVITEDSLFNVTTMMVSNAPMSIRELSEYDEVILFNIANSDMPTGLDELLYTYVNDIGGGLLTIGGNDTIGGTEANAYRKDDMYGTKYQELIPVQAIDYKPPIGVMLVIDRSGSMSETDTVTGESRLELAKNGAYASLNALDSRDWVGILSLEDEPIETASMMPLSHYKEIIKAIDSLESGGGTKFEPALRAAGQALNELKTVERKHIILVTDGLPNDEFEKYKGAIEHFAAQGITMSIVIINPTTEASEEMKKCTDLANGKFYPIWNSTTLPEAMRQDLNVPEIVTYYPEEFTPKISTNTNETLSFMNSEGIMEKIPSVYGFYGTKAKNGSTTVLSSDYTPLYSKWEFGKGNVGSYMSDLYGDSTSWSRNLMSSEYGKKFLKSMISFLLPDSIIRANDIECVMVEDNYTTTFNILSTLEEGETMEAEIVNMLYPDEIDIRNIDIFNGFGSFTFETKDKGIYTIKVTIYEDETVKKESTYYKTFSYSKEYDEFMNIDDGIALLENASESSGGAVITDSLEVFNNLNKALSRTYDPRIVFIILIIVLFLLDIAVRKFKFKWIHELIRDKKFAKGKEKGGSNE